MTKKSIALVQVETTNKQEYIRLDDSSSSLNKSHPGFPIQIETPRVQDERLVSVYFTALGIASLMAWSTLLSTLDYYHAQFPDGEVNFYFPASFTLTSFLIKLLMVWLKETLSLNTRIAAFFGLQAVMLCCLPILAGILSNTALGYWISILFLIILGAISQICNASATGLFGYFPSKYVSNFTTGTGLGGLMSNMLRVITLVFSANTEEKSYLFDMCMQYGVTGVFLIFCIILHYRFMESKYALDQINKYADTVKLAEYTSNELPLLKPRTTPHHMTNIKNGLFRLWVTFKKVPALSLFMILIYIQTLMLFPGVTLKQDIPNLDLSWKITLMMITYNFFDTLGKYVTRRRSLFNKPFIYKLIFSRFIFYFTFIAQAISTNTPILDDVWFTLLNLALFGLTNGFATSALFIFGPEELEGEDKEIVGFLLVNCLSFGIMLGSFLALPFSNL